MCSGKVIEGRGERDRGEEKWVEEQGLMVIVTEGREGKWSIGDGGS